MIHDNDSPFCWGSPHSCFSSAFFLPNVDKTMNIWWRGYPKATHIWKNYLFPSSSNESCSVSIRQNLQDLQECIYLGYCDRTSWSRAFLSPCTGIELLLVCCVHQLKPSIFCCPYHHPLLPNMTPPGPQPPTTCSCCSSFSRENGHPFLRNAHHDTHQPSNDTLTWHTVKDIPTFPMSSTIYWQQRTPLATATTTMAKF